MLNNRKLLFIVAVAYTFVLLYFSLANANGIMPETGIEFQDKVFHLGAYIGLAILWGLFSVVNNKNKALQFCFLATLGFGIILELIQENVNPLRTYDTLDLVANCLGVVLGTIFVLLYDNKRKLK